MLDSVRPLALQLDASGRQFEEAVHDFPPDAWIGRLGEEATNHAAYVALHLLDARRFLLHSLGTEIRHGFEALTEQARRLEDITEYPTPEQILSVWRRTTQKLPEALASVDDEALSGASPHRFPIDDDSLLGLIAFLAQHEAYHVGQLGMIRRAHGLSGLFPQPPE